MRRDRLAFGAVCPNQMEQLGRRTAVKKIDKTPVPRCSSPVTVYVEFPCIADQAFSTIAWEDLEDCASEVRRERDSLSSQVNESDPDDQYFGDYALDFMADSASMLESSLSPAELVPFQGFVIPPLTPQRDFAPEDSLVHSNTETGSLHAQDGIPWRGMAECHGRALGRSVSVNKQLYDTLHRQQQELDSLEERNLHLRQLASRAKDLASVLEKLMTVRDPHVGAPVTSCGENDSLGPLKRQRLDVGYETESSDTVEEMLRDISTRCNAVLLNSATAPRQQRESETIRMHGAFSGLQMSTPSRLTADGAEAGDSVSSFKTSIREHCTIRTQAFPHGHAFTSRTQQGGYRFRWVPNCS
ncbi:multicilin [Odontesthes bonariensis]|uniref:multicilin n=1 Tax=Odontesthes bonariensis TaxID=219752 RepID=UPI003F58AC52